MRILFLDDSKERWEYFKEIISEVIRRGEVKIIPTLDWASNAHMCVEKLKDHHYDLVFLDHDLEARHYGGYMDDPTPQDGRMVVKWWVENEQQSPRPHAHVHSWNYHGALEMKKILSENDFPTTQAMFPDNIADVFIAKAALL